MKRRSFVMRVLVPLVIAIPVTVTLMCAGMSFVSWIIIMPPLLLLMAITEGGAWSIAFAIFFLFCPLFFPVFDYMENKGFNLDELMGIALVEIFLIAIVLAIMARSGPIIIWGF